MKRELHELPDDELLELAIRIDSVMDEFELAHASKTHFWKTVIRGSIVVEKRYGSI